MNYLKPTKTAGYILLALIFIAMSVIFFVRSFKEPTNSNIPLKRENLGTSAFLLVFAAAASIRAVRYYKNAT
jgi:hypothetical protein